MENILKLHNIFFSFINKFLFNYLLNFYFEVKYQLPLEKIFSAKVAKKQALVGCKTGYCLFGLIFLYIVCFGIAALVTSTYEQPFVDLQIILG